MRSCKWNLCLLPALIAGLGLFLAPGAHAQFQWAKRVASTIDTDTELSIGMTLDTNGNCYVTGWFDGTNDFGGVTLTNDSGGGQDIFVAKYNSSGALQWAQRAGGSSTNRDAGRGMGVDPNGNVYAAGGYYGPANFGSINLPASASQNFFLAKYNNIGAVQWVQQGIGGNDVDGTGLAVDGAGNSYALVFANNGDTIMFGSTPVATPNDFDNNYDASTILVKFDNTGAFKWAQVMGGYGETYATKVAVDAAGNVYVRGGFSATLTIGTSNLVVSPGASENVFIAKFNNSGALIWVQVPTGGNGDEGGVAVDSTGNVYISGSFSIPLNFGGITLTNAGSLDAFVAKYNSSGAIQWAQRAGNTNLNFYWDVALDGLGNVYAGGALNSETAVAKYSPVGTLQWIYSAVGLSGNPVGSVAAKCAVDSAGNCFLAGWYQRTNTLGAYVLPPQGYWNYFLTKLAQTLAVATTSLPKGTTAVQLDEHFRGIAPGIGAGDQRRDLRHADNRHHQHFYRPGEGRHQRHRDSVVIAGRSGPCAFANYGHFIAQRHERRGLQPDLDRSRRASTLHLDEYFRRVISGIGVGGQRFDIRNADDQRDVQLHRQSDRRNVRDGDTAIDVNGVWASPCHTSADN